MEANIVNLSTIADIHHWIQGTENVYIGRKKNDIPASKWGNPHVIKRRNSRTKVLQQYAKYLTQRKDLVKSVNQLKGKTLGCWCSPKPCHAEILHRLAGNQPVYQTLKGKTRLNLKMDNLDQQVTSTLQALNDLLENDSHDDFSSIAALQGNGVPSPTLQSTEETSKIYETLLDSETSKDTSYNSSFERDFPRCAPSSPKMEQENCRIKERFDLECRLRDMRSKCNRSLQLLPGSTPSCTSFERRTASAPTSPTKYSPTLVIPSNSFSYDSSSLSVAPSLNELGDLQSSETTTKILEFLAQKIDLLSVNVNTIQFNLTKLCENLQVSIDDKVLDATQGQLSYLENKVDCFKVDFMKELETTKEQNRLLQEKLDSYILQESERNERMMECFNTPPNVPNCLIDLQPLKDELEKKLLDLDVRLVECEQYSRRESLVISGIPETVNQNQLEQKVIDILSYIGLNIVPKEISACHRLFKPPGSRFPAKVIVRFCNRKVVNYCLYYRDDMQQKAYEHLGLNLRFFESLCSKNDESLRICKRLKSERKISDYYIRNGFVKVVVRENGRPEKIKHPDILRQRFDIPCDLSQRPI